MLNVKSLFLIALSGFAALAEAGRGGKDGKDGRKPKNFIMVSYYQSILLK
jgi:hypothetical protein